MGHRNPLHFALCLYFLCKSFVSCCPELLPFSTNEWTRGCPCKKKVLICVLGLQRIRRPFPRAAGSLDNRKQTAEQTKCTWRMTSGPGREKGHGDWGRRRAGWKYYYYYYLVCIFLSPGIYKRVSQCGLCSQESQVRTAHLQKLGVV